MTYPNTMCFTPANLDGCGLWRMFFPHLNVPNSGFIFTQGPVPLDLISTYDVLCVQRLATNNNKKFLDYCRQLGMRIIYDLDDNLWQMDKKNPAREKLKVYIDGLTPEHDYGLYANMSYADVITVSTDALRKVVARETSHLRNVQTEKSIPVVVVENYVDTILFQPNEEENEQVVIGWGGSNTHFGDVDDVWLMMPAILEKYPNVRFEVVGMPVTRELYHHPRVKCRDWVHIAEYAHQLHQWNWDIFLAPLAENKFNNAKSAIKQLEAGALRKPCLASYSTNYVEFVKRSGETQIETGNIHWSLCITKSHWWDKLCYLIENKNARLELGQRFLDNVLKNYDAGKESYRWQNVCNLACQ